MTEIGKAHPNRTNRPLLYVYSESLRLMLSMLIARLTQQLMKIIATSSPIFVDHLMYQFFMPRLEAVHL